MPTGGEFAASVIIPVYNGQETLGEQLAALARQTTDRPFEVVVCDNGSTDQTRGVVAEWIGRVPGLRMVDASGVQGPSHARNRGIMEARGELLAFCDADDVVADDWLDLLLAAAEPGALLSGWTEFARLNPWRGPEPQVDGGLILREGYLYGIDTANMALMRTDALAQRGFDESCRYVEDVDFAWRAQQGGMKVVDVPAIVHTRLRPTASGSFRQYRNWARYSILLRTRNQSAHPMPLSFRYTATTLAKTVATAPYRWVKSDEPGRARLAQTLGALSGEFDGHVRYRLLGRVPARKLVDLDDGVAPDTGQIRRVVFALHSVGALGGVQTVLDTLAGRFQAAGLEIAYAIERPAVGPVAVPGPTYLELKYLEKTSEHPFAERYPGPFGLRLMAKRGVTPLWRMWRRFRRARYLESLSPETAVIMMTPTPGLQFLRHGGQWRAGSEARPLIIGQAHNSPEMAVHFEVIDKFREIASDADVFLALSDSDASGFAQALGREIAAMPNPSPQPPMAGSPVGRRPQIAFVGRLAAEKRVDRLIRAFDLAAARVPDWTLEIYGDGDVRESLEALAASLEHVERVAFHGATVDRSSVLRESSLLALSSDFEGLPMVMLEAAGCGTPVVSTLSSEAVADLVDACGFPVPEMTDEAMAEVLVHAMTSPELRELKGAQSLEAAGQYSAEVVAGLWFELFRTRSTAHLFTAQPPEDLST